MSDGFGRPGESVADKSDLSVEAGADSLNSRFQGGQAMGADAPENARPHLRVVMAQDIP
jgi:hypothetical protein